MKAGKKPSVLAAGALAMSLLLGANAAQAADVIFEPGTDRAIGIENLQVGSTFYDVTFHVQATAASVYGAFPGTYTFTDEFSAADARDAVIFELNAANALGIGEPGDSFNGESLNVGYEGIEVLSVQSVRTARAILEGTDWVSLGLNAWTYNLDEKNYVVFSPAGGDPSSIFTDGFESGDTTKWSSVVQ